MDARSWPKSGGSGPTLRLLLRRRYSRETAYSFAYGYDGWAFILKPYRVAAVMSMLQDVARVIGVVLLDLTLPEVL